MTIAEQYIKTTEEVIRELGWYASNGFLDEHIDVGVKIMTGLICNLDEFRKKQGCQEQS